MTSKGWVYSLVILTGVYSQPVFSACPTLDMRAPGYSMENVYTEDQQKMGVCYALAGLKKYEAHLKLLKKVPPNFIPSMLHSIVMTNHSVKLENLKEDALNFLSGGFPVDFLSNLHAAGVCPLEALEESPLFKSRSLALFGEDHLVLEDLLKAFFHLMQEQIDIKLRKKENKIANFEKNKAALRAKIENLKSPELKELKSTLSQVVTQMNDYPPEEFKEKIAELQIERDELKKKIKNLMDHLGINLLEKEYSKKFSDERLKSSQEKVTPLSALNEYAKTVNRCVRETEKDPTQSPAFYDLLESVQKILDLLDPKDKTSPIKFLQAFLRNSCKDRTITLTEEYKISSEKDSSQFENILNEEFKKGQKAEPIYAVIQAGAVTNISQGEDPTEPHAVLVVGQKEINGECRYILRNSWGTRCSKYQKENLFCENGDLYLKKEDFFRLTEQIVY